MGFGDVFTGMVDKIETTDEGTVLWLDNGNRELIPTEYADKFAHDDFVEIHFDQGLLRGIFVNGVPAWFLSDEEMTAQRDARKAAQEQEADAAFASVKDTMLSEIDALPEPYKLKIKEMADKSKNFLRDRGEDTLQAAKAAILLQDILETKFTVPKNLKELQDNINASIKEDGFAKTDPRLQPFDWSDVITGIRWAAAEMAKKYNLKP